jgi:hypothetical protein
MRPSSMVRVLWVAVLMVVGCDDAGAADPSVVGDEDSSVQQPSDSDAAAQERDAGDASAIASDAGVDASAQLQQDAGTDAGELGDAAHADAGTDSGAPDTSSPCTTVYYRDADGDGFGSPQISLASCSKPDGYVDNANDCYDSNEKAKPGQTGRFKEHRGDGSYDYDCDGAATPIKDRVAIVPDLSTAACPPPPKQTVACDYATQSAAWRDAIDGWYLAVPACGVQAGYGPGCTIAWDDVAKSYACNGIGPPPERAQTCN